MSEGGCRRRNDRKGTCPGEYPTLVVRPSVDLYCLVHYKNIETLSLCPFCAYIVNNWKTAKRDHSHTFDYSLIVCQILSH